MLFKSIGMLFSFIDENRFVIKTILLTKYTSILLQLIGNLNLKIMYKNITIESTNFTVDTTNINQTDESNSLRGVQLIIPLSINAIE